MRFRTSGSADNSKATSFSEERSRIWAGFSFRHALAAVFAVAVVLPGAALAAQPVERFHDNFRDTVSDEVCGIPVDGVAVGVDNFFVFADDSFKDTSSVTVTPHEPRDRQVGQHLERGSGQGHGDRGREGRNDRVRHDVQGSAGEDPDGSRAGAPAGRRSRHLPRRETGELISSDVIIKGPHPDAESDFELFCEVVTPELT